MKETFCTLTLFFLYSFHQYRGIYIHFRQQHPILVQPDTIAYYYYYLVGNFSLEFPISFRLSVRKFKGLERNGNGSLVVRYLFFGLVKEEQNEGEETEEEEEEEEENERGNLGVIGKKSDQTHRILFWFGRVWLRFVDDVKSIVCTNFSCPFLGSIHS